MLIAIKTTKIIQVCLHQAMFCRHIPWHIPYIGLIYSTLRTGHYLQAKNKCMRVGCFQFVLNPPPDELPAAELLDEPWSVQDWSSCLNWAGHTICLFISIHIHTYPYVSIHNIYIYIWSPPPTTPQCVICIVIYSIKCVFLVFHFCLLRI